MILLENWKTINFATNYEISDQGNIRNKKTGQVLNPGICGQGYKQVSIKFDDTGKFKKQYVHRLVAMMWLDNPENKREVNHKNLDRSDNRVENLEWVTSSENQQHKFKNNQDYKTSDRQVVQYDVNNNIIKIWPSVISAAKALGISRQGIDRCIHHTYNRVTAGGFKWEFLN